jgi:hypothetical protein
VEAMSAMEQTRQYVQNASIGMYKSGALMSFTGGLNFAPPATCSCDRDQCPFSANGKINSFSLFSTYRLFTVK